MSSTAESAREATPHGAGPASPPAVGQFTHKQILTILFGLLMGMFLAALDQTIVATAIRTIGDDLHGLSIQAWVTTAYLITSTIATPLYGKLSDLYGRKPFFLLAISLFVVGSIACTFSTSMYMLAAFRAFQGLGAGGLFSLALAIIGDIVSPRERARYQGYFLAVFGTSSVLGPVIGGFLSGQASILFIAGWRWVFLVNVPIGILALIVVWRTLNIPHTRRDHQIDWKGAVALVIFLTPLLIIAEQGRLWGWASERAFLCYGVGGLGLLIFLIAETRIGRDALLPLRFFRNKTFTITSLGGMLVGLGMFGLIALLPLYLQIVKGVSPTKSGLLMLPLTGGIMVASIISGQLISRTGHYKIFPIIGSAMMVVGFVLMHSVGADTPFVKVAIFSAVFGFGLGNIMQPITLAVQNAMPPQDIGVATSSATFFRQIGATIGTAVFLSILFSTAGGNIERATKSAARTDAFQSALHDPSVLNDPRNATVLKALQGHGVGNGMLNDTAFLKHANSTLAHPFFVGFSDSMDTIFVLGAIVAAMALIVLLFLPAIPLRKQSGLDAQRAGNTETGPDGVSAGAAAAVPEPHAVPEVRAEEDLREPVLVGAPAGAADLGAPAPEPALVSAAHTGATVTAMAGEGGTDPEAGQSGSSAWEADGAGRHAADLGGGTPELNGFAGSGADGYGAGEGPAIRGRIRGANGAPMSGTALTLIDMSGRQIGRAHSGDDGGYHLQTPGAGHYVLIAHAPGHQPNASTVELGSGPVDFDVVLAGSAGIGGTVRTAKGDAVGGAVVTVTNGRGEVVTSRMTELDGRYDIRDLASDQYTLVVSGRGYRPVALLVDVPATGTAQQDVELVGGANLQGVARAGSDRHPLPDARVSLIDAEGNVAAVVRTDENGAYCFQDMPAGEYTVIATSYPPVTATVSIDGGREHEHDIELGYPAGDEQPY